MPYEEYIEKYFSGVSFSTQKLVKLVKEINSKNFWSDRVKNMGPNSLPSEGIWHPRFEYEPKLLAFFALYPVEGKFFSKRLVKCPFSFLAL